MLRRRLAFSGFLAVALALAGAAGDGAMTAAKADLAAGASAPDFTLDAALAGKTFRFSLSGALQHGPVVVYFYPAAFTSGCTQEAHDFAEAMPRYQALGATVIGVSGDGIATLEKFSESACGGQFAVAADPGRNVLRDYGVLATALSTHATRTSYVIVPDGSGRPGRVAYTYTNNNPDQHVANTLQALHDWQTSRASR